MASIFRMGGASASPEFDAAAWFANWSAAGGIALVANDGLVLSRTPAISAIAHRRLDFLRGEILRLNGSEAVKAMLLARREVEARS